MLKMVIAIVWIFAVGSSANAETWYVSGGAGGDCQRATPCDTIASAIARSLSGDTIICVSPPLTNSGAVIEKSLTIDCRGSGAYVADVAIGSPRAGLIVNIPSNDVNGGVVRLRGLNLEGGTTGGAFYDRGIDIVSAGAVFVEDCVISNISKAGIYDRRTAGKTRLYVRDTVINSVGGPGIVAAAQGGSSTVLENVSLLNSTYGIAAAIGKNVVVSRSTVSGHSTAGVHADSGAQINVLNSALSHNTTNIVALGVIRLQESAIQFSNADVQGSNARSGGGNRFFGNVAIGAVPAPVTGAPADVFD